MAPSNDKSPLACLVVIDGSPFSRTAVVVAAELQARLGIEVHLISVVARPEAVSRRRRLLDGIRVNGCRVPATVVVDHEPSGAIIALQRTLGGALVCLASHGRARRAWLRPSVPNEMITRSHEPIVLAGPSLGRPKGVGRETDVSLAAFRGGGVTACLDGSPNDKCVVEVAAQWAQRMGEPLVGLTVTQPLVPVIAGDRLARSPGRRRGRIPRGHASAASPPHPLYGPDGDVRRYLNEQLQPALERGVAIREARMTDPIGPAEGVHSYLELDPAALVVVGARHRGKRSALGLSGTPATIVRRSPSPVAVVG